MLRLASKLAAGGPKERAILGREWCQFWIVARETGPDPRRHCEDPERSEGDEAIAQKTGTLRDAIASALRPSQ